MREDALEPAKLDDPSLKVPEHMGAELHAYNTPPPYPCFPSVLGGDTLLSSHDCRWWMWAVELASAPLVW